MKLLFSFFLCAFIAHSAFCQYTLIKDFNGTSASTFSYSSSNRFLAKLGTKVFVQYDTTNLVPTTETLLSSIDFSGQREKIFSAPSTSFYDFKELPNGKMAFVANLSSTTFKIFITDGTNAGTQEIYTTSKVIEGMELISSGLFFTHQKEAASEYELMKINTTTNAVTNVFDLGWWYYASDVVKTNDDTLVFMATDPADNTKLNLYATDGTTIGTTSVAFIQTGSRLSQQTVMTNVGDKVFFFNKEAGIDCCNFLWVTDGTIAGTTKLSEFNTVDFVNYERYRNALDFNDKFYFMAVANGGNSNNDRVLWVSDGTALGTFALNDASVFTKPSYLTVFNGKLYFSGYAKNSYNYELFVTDGTVLGTQNVGLTYDTRAVYAYELITDNTHLFVAADCYNHGAEIFRYDGINTSCELSEGSPSTATSDPKELFVNGTEFYFTADITAYGREVFTTTFGATPLSILPEYKNSTFTLFPNPANNHVELKTEKNIVQVALLNATGKTLLLTDNTTLNLENYPAGIYFIKITLEDFTTVSNRFIIAR